MTIYSASYMARGLGATALRLQMGSPVLSSLLSVEARAQGFLETGFLRTEVGGGDRTPNNPKRSGHKDKLRHILLGSPEEIRQAIHQLHVLNYVEPVLWSPIMAVGEQIVITPKQGEAMSLLRR